MRGKKQPFLAAVVLAVLSLLAAACGGSSDGDTAASGTTRASPPSPDTTTSGGALADPLAPQPLAEKTSVRMVTPATFEGFLPPLLAAELGEFEKENLDVSIEVTSTSDGLTLVGAGRAEIQLASFLAGTFNVVNSGLPVAWVAHVFNGDTSQQGLWVRNEFLLPDGTIDPEKIKGLRVTLGTSTNLEASAMYYFYEWLQENGATVDDVEFVTIGSAADMLVALESGAIDAAALLTPFWIEAQDIAKPVAGVGFQSSAYVINTDWEAEYPEAATAFFRAIARTIDENLTGDYKSDPELVQTIADIVQVEPEAVEKSPPLIYDPELPLDVEVAEGLQDIWLEIGDIFDYSEPLDIGTIVNTAPVDRIYGRR